MKLPPLYFVFLDVMCKIINWIRDPIYVIFHEGSNKRGRLCLAQKKGQLFSVDEGHLFMRCFCSPNCFLKRLPSFECLVGKHILLNCVRLTSHIPRTKLWLTSLSSNTGVSIVSAPWRLKVEMIMSKTWQIFLNTLVQEKIKDLVSIEARECRLPVHERENPGYFKTGWLPRKERYHFSSKTILPFLWLPSAPAGSPWCPWQFSKSVSLLLHLLH